MGSRFWAAGMLPLLAAAAALTIAVGCDRRSGSTSSTGGEGENATVSSADTPAPATRPTTQQLLEGPTKRIGLVLLPLSVEAPESWQVKTLNLTADPQPTGRTSTPEPPAVGATSLTELVGPAPSGDIQIQLAQRLPWQAERLERMLKAAQRDAESQQKSGGMMKFEIRQQEGMRVMEQQKVLTPPDAGPKLLDWRITYFAPRRAASAGAGSESGGTGAVATARTGAESGGAGAGAGGTAGMGAESRGAGATLAAAGASPTTMASEYDACELNFINLTVDQYERDRQFLQKIIDSVRYDPAAQSVAPPSLAPLDSLKPPER